MPAKVNASQCDGCGTCAEVCSTKGVTVINKKAVVNEECIDCETCISVCPNQALAKG